MKSPSFFIGAAEGCFDVKNNAVRTGFVTTITYISADEGNRIIIKNSYQKERKWKTLVFKNVILL